MNQLLYIGVFALLLILIAHIGIKLFLLDKDNIEMLHPHGIVDNNDDTGLYNVHENTNLNIREDTQLWKDLTENNNTNTQHPSRPSTTYGPGPARSEHAHPGKRGKHPAAIPDYPIPLTPNELATFQASLKQELEGYLEEQSIDDYFLMDQQRETPHVSNMPQGKPIVGRPTKQPYKEVPLGIEDRTSDGNYKSYENIMYGQDISKFEKNKGVNPYTDDGKYYASYDISPVLGH